MSSFSRARCCQRAPIHSSCTDQSCEIDLGGTGIEAALADQLPRAADRAVEGVHVTDHVADKQYRRPTDPRGSESRTFGEAPEIHDYTLRRQLPVCTEAVEGDERELDVALRGRMALEVPDVPPTESPFDHDLVGGEVLAVDDPM